jgi:CHASE2 domain-containing sensor protein
MSDDRRSKTEADQRTLLALSLVMFAALLLLGLTALVVPALLGIVLVVGGMILFGSAHYVVWGWWLPRFLKRDRDDDE